MFLFMRIIESLNFQSPPIKKRIIYEVIVILFTEPGVQIRKNNANFLILL